MENNVVVSIGSNINPEQNIEKALAFLSEQSTVEAKAPHLVTKPIGIADQSDFVNTLVRIATPLGREELNLFLKTVEDRVGRDRSRPKFGPREIDLDILAWNGTIVDDDFYDRQFLKDLYDMLGL